MKYRGMFLFALLNLSNMKTITALLLLALLSLACLGQQICKQEDKHLLNYLKKAMTYQVTQWPVQENNWAGKFACNGCDPIAGDTPCTSSLPILCIIHPKVIDRPFYSYSHLPVPYQNEDRGYYNGWTGGIFATTAPVRGYDIESYAAGDKLCKDHWGKNAKFAQFKDGWYMKDMNNRTLKAWRFWNWKEANCGGWAFWGYFNTNYNGRVWTWIDSQPKSNCGAI